MQGPSVRQVQICLNNLIGAGLATDGVFGALTEAAVREFQRRMGQNVDGLVGPITWNNIFTRCNPDAGGVAPTPPPPPPTPNPVPPFGGVLIRNGSRGDDVRRIQGCLNSLNNAGLNADGVFGPLTEAAVRNFQTRFGLNSDGLVGPLTWNAIFSRCTNPQPPFGGGTTPPTGRRTIVLDAGHGGSDPGAVNGTRQEKNDNLRLARAVRDILVARGQNVIMTRDSDIFLPLQERSNISNRSNADIFVSLHRNGFSNPAANGVETFVSMNPSQIETRNANFVQNALVNVGVQSNRGVKNGNFVVLRNTNAPSMLVELGFITNARDNELFDTNFNAYATAIADGIMQSLG